MGDLFQDNSDEPSQADNPRPSIEAIVAAARKAAGQQPEQGKVGVPSPAQPSLEPPPTPTKTPAEKVEETIAAFRKAERQVSKRRAEERREVKRQTEETEPDSSEARGGESAESPDEDSPGKEPGRTGGAEEGEEQAGGEETESSDELSLAFRRALSNRESSSEREGLNSESSMERGPEAEGHLSSEESPPPTGSSSSPARSSSFLWVTDSPTDTLAAVLVEDLSGQRAQEAEAFLLRGGGNRPYQLLKRIRSHPDVSIYLKPVFWRRAPGQKSPVADHVDGEWTPEADEGTLRALQQQAAAINQRVSDLIEAGSGGEEGAALRMLRFVASRSAEFAPRRTTEGEDEVVYPKLTPFLEPPSQNGTQYGDGELTEILSMTARRIREKRSSR